MHRCLPNSIIVCVASIVSGSFWSVTDLLLEFFSINHEGEGLGKMNFAAMFAQPKHPKEIVVGEKADPATKAAEPKPGGAQGKFFLCFSPRT